jgi:hypothetical protein
MQLSFCYSCPYLVTTVPVLVATALVLLQLSSPCWKKFLSCCTCHCLVAVDPVLTQLSLSCWSFSCLKGALIVSSQRSNLDRADPILLQPSLSVSAVLILLQLTLTCCSCSCLVAAVLVFLQLSLSCCSCSYLIVTVNVFLQLSRGSYWSCHYSLDPRMRLVQYRLRKESNVRRFSQKTRFHLVHTISGKTGRQISLTFPEFYLLGSGAGTRGWYSTPPLDQNSLQAHSIVLIMSRFQDSIKITAAALAVVLLCLVQRIVVIST